MSPQLITAYGICAVAIVLMAVCVLRVPFVREDKRTKVSREQRSRREWLAQQRDEPTYGWSAEVADLIRR